VPATTGPAVAAVLLAAVLFGTTGTAQALGPDTTSPLGVGAVRLAVGGLALLLVLPLVRGSARAATRLWRTPVGLLAGGCTALYQVCFFAGVERAGVALGTLVTIGSGPVFAGLLGAVLLRERVEASWLVATGTCVGGLALLSLAGGADGGAEPVGLLLALTSGAAYAAYTVAAKRLIRAGAASSDVMASAFALGGLLLLPLLATQPLAWLATPGGWALAAHLGLVTTTAGYLLFGRGLAVLGAGPVTTLVLAEPLVATALGVGVLDERLPRLGVAGAALVLAGLALQGVASTRRRAAVPSDARRDDAPVSVRTASHRAGSPACPP
jgi:DME family drug/metabolite transporter